MIGNVFARSRGASLLGGALAAVCLLTALPVSASAAMEENGVSKATVEVQDAHAQVADLRTALDETAAQYEHANAHRIRLQDELADADVLINKAADAVTVAEDNLGNRIADAYKHPGDDLALPAGLLDAPDAPSVLHRAALYRRLIQRSADEVDLAERISAQTVSDVRQEQIIASGAQASVNEWKRQGDRLTEALEQAQADVERAESGLVAAREEAARRAAEQARLEQQLQMGAAPAGPLPPLDGRTCPIGTPNGFIDSWGFPRSGGRTHEGVDMFAPYGTPLYAVADGVIYRVYNNPLGGLSINLIDDAGNMYYYTHLSSASVTSGQSIRMGEVIGAVGQSGNAAGTPPHLHWQFHPGNGAPVNPYPLAFALCR